MDRFDRVQRWLNDLWHRHGWGWALVATLGLAALAWLWIVLTR